MKKWPEELQNVQPTSETFVSPERYRFYFDCEISEEQHRILRGFLFDLTENEKFLFFHEELSRELVGELGSARAREIRSNPDTNEEKRFDLYMSIRARNKP